jgi:hypothetical protein
MTPFEPEMREFLEPSRVFHYAPVPAQALWNLKWYAKVDARYVRRLTDYGFDFKLYKEEAQFLSSCHCAVVNIGRSFYDMTKWRFNLVHPQSEADYRAAKLKLSNASVSLHVRYLTAESVTQTQTYALKFLWEMYEENVERLAYLFGGWSPVDSGDPVSDELAVAESAKTELTEFEDTDLRALPFKATRLTVVRAYLDAVYAVKPLPFSAEIPVKTEYALTDD